jgi:UDP-glucuronate 4-epimerase
MGIAPVIQWAPMQPGDVQLTCADVEKARRVLGFEARTPFAEGIRRFAAWFRRAYAGTTS